MAFKLDERLAEDAVFVAQLRLCQVLLMNDKRFAWLVLVPTIEGLVEITDLGASEREELMDEIVLASDVLKEMVQPHKMNVAALGNMVSQLHVHVIARQKDDAAWPKPVWGVGTAEPYKAEDLEDLLHKLSSAFADA